jgi:hypothetical protein
MDVQPVSTNTLAPSITLSSFWRVNGRKAHLKATGLYCCLSQQTFRKLPIVPHKHLWRCTCGRNLRYKASTRLLFDLLPTRYDRSRVFVSMEIKSNRRDTATYNFVVTGAPQTISTNAHLWAVSASAPKS